MVIVRRFFLTPKVMATGLKDPEIINQWRPRFIYISTGLLQCQRQVPQLLRQSLGSRLVLQAGALDEKGHRLGPGQHLHPQRAGQPSPGRVSGRNYYMAATT